MGSGRQRRIRTERELTVPATLLHAARHSRRGRDVGVLIRQTSEPGAQPTADVYTSRMEKGGWQPAQRYESKLLDSIGFKCRLNGVSRDGLVLGVVSVHDFGKFHTMLFVHYDPTSKQWKGPIVEAPFNNPAIDGACPMFTAGGDKMIWSAGDDRGPGPVSTAGAPARPMTCTG